jgi:hypothetical protein
MNVLFCCEGLRAVNQEVHGLDGCYGLDGLIRQISNVRLIRVPFNRSKKAHSNGVDR